MGVEVCLVVKALDHLIWKLWVNLPLVKLLSLPCMTPSPQYAMLLAFLIGENLHYKAPSALIGMSLLYKAANRGELALQSSLFHNRGTWSAKLLLVALMWCAVGFHNREELALHKVPFPSM